MRILTADNGRPTSFVCEHCGQHWTGSPDDVPVRERIRHARRECGPGADMGM